MSGGAGRRVQPGLRQARDATAPHQSTRL